MGRKSEVREMIKARIMGQKGEDVFLPREFEDLGRKDEVSRALRGLVREKFLMKLSYGVYARAGVSRLSGAVIVFCPDGFLGAAQQALTKLGVAWEMTEAQKAYNAGHSTQVPVNPVVRISGRFARRLSDGTQELVIERRHSIGARARK